MPVGFGYSAGDIVVAIQLLSKVYKGLRETAGSVSEYREISGTLRSLILTLQHLADLQRTCTDPSLTNAIQSLSEAALNPVMDFLEEVRKYDPALSHGSTTNRFSAGYRKTEWALRVPKRITKLKADIALQLEPIHVLMESATLQNIDINSKLLSTVQEELRNQALTQLQFNTVLMDAVKDLSTAFQTSHDSLSITSTTAKASPSVDQIDNGSFDQSTSSPINEGRDESAIGPTDLSQAQLVGEQLCTMLLALLIKLKVFTKYLLLMSPRLLFFLHHILTTLSNSTRLLVQDCIYFEDVLGRHYELPYQYFSIWEVFEPFLQHNFKQQVGETLISNGNYHILNSVHGRIIRKTPSQWSRAVFPGTRLMMSVIIQPIELWSSCPKCRACLRTIRSGDKKQTCPACPWERYLDAQDEHITSDPMKNNGSGMVDEQKTYEIENRSAAEEVSLFTRIHALPLSELVNLEDTITFKCYCGRGTVRAYEKCPYCLRDYGSLSVKHPTANEVEYREQSKRLKEVAMETAKKAIQYRGRIGPYIKRYPWTNKPKPVLNVTTGTRWRISSDTPEYS